MIDPRQPDYTNTPSSASRALYGYQPANFTEHPAVSLITPFYNAGQVFLETVESVRRQSLQQWEWIVVDDGSDDPESLSILEAFSQGDPRIRIIRTAGRQGPSAARNLGVASACAKYVAFLDSDDLFEPTALEKWLWFLECHSQYSMVKGYQVGFGASEYIWQEGFHSGAAPLERNLIQTASMIRRSVYQAVGGMDEDIRGGMEDWDFWLRCANAGYWGGTIPEVLDWYRRRKSHSERWEDWDGSRRQSAFRSEMQRRYPKLFQGEFPQPVISGYTPNAGLPTSQPCENRLARDPNFRRILILVPHLVMGGSDKFTLDLAAELSGKHSFRVTVATTLASDHPWRHQFEKITPDVFTLDTLLRLVDYPRFVSYLITSRGIDSVLVTHGQLGYQLLPYLRAQFPEIRCYDYVHIEEPEWKDGGYPAYSITYSAFLDRTVASSEHLKDWMTERGTAPEKISVVTTNIDSEEWRRDRYDGDTLRRKWELPEDVPVILFAGRLCEQKQPHVMAGAIRLLHERGLRFLCLVAGGGEEEHWLRDYVNRYRLAELRVLGPRSNEEVRELLAASDIFFLPSRHEGISVALYEAMAMSSAVVRPMWADKRELVTPDCGMIVARGPDEANRYADTLSSLLRTGSNVEPWL